MPKTLLIAICWLGLACSPQPAKLRPFNAQPLEPEPWYADLYNDVRRCALLTNTFSGLRYADIEWYVYPAGSLPDIAGFWSKPNRIYLDANYVIIDPVIKHELGHAVLQAGSNTHHDTVFKLCTGT